MAADEARREAKTKLDLGWAALRDGHTDAAGMALSRAAELFAAIGDRLGEGDANLGLAGLGEKTNDLAAARDAANKAERLFREAGDGAKLGSALILLGQLETHANDADAARSAFASAASAFATTNNKPAEAAAYVAIGGLETELRRFDAGAAAYDKARRLFVDAADPAGEATVLAKLAEVAALHAQDDHQVRTYLTQAADLLDSLNDHDGAAQLRDPTSVAAWLLKQARAEVAAGQIASGVKSYEMAQLMFWIGDDAESAATVYDETRRLLRGDRSRAGALALGGLAEHAKRHGDTVRARAAYDDGLELSKHLNDGELEAGFLLAIAGLDLNDGKALQAERSARAAIVIYEALGAAEPQAFAAVLLGGVNVKLGRRLDALQSYRVAVELYASLGMADTAAELAEVVDNLTDGDG